MPVEEQTPQQHPGAHMLHRTASMPQHSYYVTEQSNPGVATMNTNPMPAQYQVPRQPVERLPLEIPYSAPHQAMQSSPSNFSAGSGRSPSTQEGFYTHQPTQTATYALHAASPVEHAQQHAPQHQPQPQMVPYAQQVSTQRPGDKANNSEVRAENQTTKFADVHGATEAKDELQELVDFLRNPDKFSTLGGKLPKGILLVGPPGTGKTLLARAVAGEAGVPFFYMSGSEFDEVYVGVGAKRVRDLFTSAKDKSPAIIFIDELDAIGGKRNARDASYVKQTLNQLLTELDGFEQNSGVIIIAATNFPEALDKALTRPGRFDRHVTVSLPDVRGRIDILKHHAKKIKAAPEINFEAIAASTSGLSGAELENIVNQAAVRASRLKETAVTMRDFEWAKDKVIMGAERKTVIGEKEKEMT
ncbi:hypothetical protein BN1723_018632, partial [Verticillium longisporum]